MSKPSSPYLRAMGGPSTRRDPRDFYPTKHWAIRAMLACEKFEGEVWEPACGRGDMARLLEAAGYQVRATDLYDYNYGEPGVDFLKEGLGGADNIMTNPPFSLDLEFVKMALHRYRRKVVMLLRLGFLETVKRSRFLRQSGLARVWVFPDRITMWPGGRPLTKGGGKIAYAIFVWERGHRGPWAGGWAPEKRYVGG